MEAVKQADGTSLRFNWSVRLILVGLFVELLSLFALHHPLGFVLFAAVGGTLVAVGVAIFLWSLLSLVRTPQSDE